jgi:glycosyltransferase involved in cell wall biosynthesis
MFAKDKNNKRNFVSIIWGYHEHFYGFYPDENYHLHILKIAKSLGLKPWIIIKGDKNIIKNDPNFDPDIEIIEYENIFNFIFQVIRFSLQNSLFYINSLEWQSFIVPFLSRKTIFMAHTQPKRQTPLKQKIQNFVYRFFTAIRLNNEAEKEFLIQQGTDIKKLFVIPLIVSQNIFKLTNVDQERKDLVYFGNISPIKNIPTIIKALGLVNQKYSDIKLNIVGKNYIKDFLKEEFESNPNIILHGYMDQDSKLANLLNLTLISINSSLSEGQCVAVYDTALCGNVLCLPKIMSFTDTFKDKALFHDIYDYEELAKNILYYLDNPDIIKRYQKECVEMIEKDYSTDMIENKLKDLIKNI